MPLMKMFKAHMCKIINIHLGMNYVQNIKGLKYDLENTRFYLHTEINLRGKIKFIFSLMSKKRKKYSAGAMA